MTHLQYEAIKKYDNEEGKQPVWRCKLGWLLNRSKDFSTFTAELFLEIHIILSMRKSTFFYLAVLSVGGWNAPCGSRHFMHLVDKTSKFGIPEHATSKISGGTWKLEDSSAIPEFWKKMCIPPPRPQNLGFVISASVQLHETNLRTKKTPGQLWETTWGWISTSLVPFLYPEKFTFTLFWENCENTFFIPQDMNKFMSEEKKLHQCQVFKGRKNWFK